MPRKKVNNAKYCKKCRQSNLNEIRKNDKERKKFEREYRKYCESKKYEEYLRKERETKRKVDIVFSNFSGYSSKYFLSTILNLSRMPITQTISYFRLSECLSFELEVWRVEWFTSRLVG